MKYLIHNKVNFTAASTGNPSKEEAVAYSASYYKELDNQSAVRFAAKTNYRQGMKAGRMEEKLETAAKMKAAGMSHEQICGFTGLSADQVEEL